MSHPRATDPSVKLNVLTLEDRTTPTYPVALTPGTYVEGQVLFSIAPGADRNQTLTALANSPFGLTAQELGFGVFKLTLKPGVTAKQALDGLYGNGWLGFVEPDFRRYKEFAPNDPSEQDGTLWAHNNTGQNGGKVDADIDAYEGWDIGRGTGRHIIAVLDDGVDYTHEDLAANMWVNPGEIAGNGIDDDSNGVIDDVHGYDPITGDGDPMPDVAAGDDHGTHVAGILGAVGNNGVGVSGVAQKTRIMAIRWLAAGGGSASQEVASFAYAVANGASIIQGSYGGYSAPSASELAAVNGATAAGVICVFSAGNNGTDNDTNPHTPSDIAATNARVIAVAATDRNDLLANFSNYGATTVTLGAPGVEIYSTQPGNQYQFLDGTSMATPQVSGALAVVWDRYPTLTPDELISLLKDNTDPLADLQGKSVTGGRLNLFKMLTNATFGGYAIGADAGGGPNVQVYSTGGGLRTSFYAYDAKFAGGVRIAYQDVTGDRIPDIITVPGAGGGPNVKVFDGATLQELYSFFAYDPLFTSGLYVAAGDLDGDGVAEIVTAAGESGGPNVRVFKMLGNRRISQEASFYAYAAGFTGGVRVAVGDVTGDGVNEIITAPGFGGGPHVRAFTAASVLAGKPVSVKDFMGGDPNSPFGAYVTVGNLNNDGIDDIVVGSGAHHREVRAYDGKTLVFIGGFNVFAPGASATRVTSTAPVVGGLINPNSTPTQLVGDNSSSSASSTPTKPYAGLRVALVDLNQDGIEDIVATGGPGDTSTVYLRNGQTMTTIGNDKSPFGNAFAGGAFVAASR